MPHSGSFFSTSSNVFCDARYQKECWYSMARLNSFCASGVHDVWKFTLPSCSSTWANAGWASTAAAPTEARRANDFGFMSQLPNGMGPWAGGGHNQRELDHDPNGWNANAATLVARERASAFLMPTRIDYLQ